MCILNLCPVGPGMIVFKSTRRGILSVRLDQIKISHIFFCSSRVSEPGHTSQNHINFAFGVESQGIAI